MTTTESRPPYLFGLLAGAVVLLGYLVSLAPTVTFWDAGEFIAAAKILGIPHPPGTPLFVLLGHVWGSFLPFGEFAYRTNLMSASFSAAAAGLWFLVAYEILGSGFAAHRPLRLAGAFAASLASAFTFTNWQNSNETEVYSIATFMIAAIAWLCLRWRIQRGGPRAPRTLWLILYVAGLSIGNHLLTLLVGPAVVLFMAMTLRSEPAPDPTRRGQEWAEVWVVGGTWVLLIGMGLGSTPLTVLGGICFLLAAGYAVSRGVLGFALVALLIASVGMTSYGYLYFRSQQHPIINEAQPDNFDALLAVIRREQYPPRTPLDDPTVLSGAGNPGRSFSLIAAQFANYGQYFDWQWASGFRATLGKFPLRTVVTVLFLFLGIQGMLLHRRLDRPSWWLILGIFLITGVGLVLYMNFKPGFSLAYTFEKWPDPSDHEVRDRDYFFVASFVTWGLWAGLGLLEWARRAADRLPRAALAGAVLAIGALPFVLNFPAARRNNPVDSHLAADIAYNLLNSAPPYGILFTYGDNDTFPLWWAQEVGGIRRDVTVVCLALAQTEWYIRQLKAMPVRPFDEATAPAIWKGKAGPVPDRPLHQIPDELITQITSAATVFSNPQPVPVGQGFHTLPANRPLNPNEIVVAWILRDNAGRRPIVWSVTAGRNFKGLEPFILQQGLGNRVMMTLPDTTSRAIHSGQLFGVKLDLVTSDSLLWHTYRYAGLIEASEEELARLDPTAAGMAYQLGVPFSQMALAFQETGNRDAMLANLERAAHLVADPQMQAVLQQLRFAPILPPESDTTPNRVSGER